MLTKAQVDTAANWWSEKVRGGATHDNGADCIQSFMAMMMADKMVKPQEDDKVEKFRNLLKDAMFSDYYSFNSHEFMTLSCDYGPDRILSDCAEKADIFTINFPWKTTMRFGNGGVQVKEGYGADYESLELIKTPLNKDDILRLLKFINKNIFDGDYSKFIVSYKAALVLYGIFDTTKDIDICAPKDLAIELAENWKFKTAPSPGYDGSTSRITISNDIEMFDNDTFEDHDAIIKDFNGFLVMIDHPEQILKLYKDMNREKDQETIKRIEEYLKRKE